MFIGFTSNKRPADETKNKHEDKSHQHLSRKEASSRTTHPDKDHRKDEKENNKLLVLEKGGSKKMRLLGKYFQVHKKLFIPIPGLFSKNRLYKAQSCSSLSRDKVCLNSEAVLRNRQRAVSVIRNSIGSDGDINQNTGAKEKRNSAVLNGFTDMCAVHLGQASKCSFC